MNPTTVLMLSRAIEDDRRRAATQRRSRFLEPKAVERPAAERERTDIWALPLRVPRFRPAR